MVRDCEEYLEEALPEGGCLGFDGRVVNARSGKELEDRLEAEVPKRVLVPKIERHCTRHIQVNPLAAIPSPAVIPADHPDSLTVLRDAKLFGRFTRNTQKTHNLFLLLDVLG